MSYELLNNQANRIAVIELKGEPYHQEREDGVIIDCTKTFEQLALNSGYETALNKSIAKNRGNLAPLFEGGYYGINARIKKGNALSFQEAFSLMSFVSMGVNRLVYSKLHAELSPEVKSGPTDPETILLQSIALLSAMSAKEGYVGLTPEEVAGLAAATIEIDTIIRVPARGSVLGIGGMGGDKGYKRDGDHSKLFSLSTMGAVVMANFGYVHKHHSYPNTSRVAGQSAIEAFGARSDQSSLRLFEQIQNQVGLIMTSCHTTRLIHSLSHRLKGETINHVVGPISVPADSGTPLNAFVGVNDNVHPETIIQSLAMLQQKGVQKYANSVAFFGLNGGGVSPDHLDPNRYYRNKDAKEAVAIDEVAPPPYSTLAAFLVNGQNRGTYVIEPEDFMDRETLRQIDIRQLLIPNTEKDIIRANIEALTGRDISKSLYLGMTAALALFTREYAGLSSAFDQRLRRINRGYMRDAFSRTYNVIRSGAAYEKLIEYVEATKRIV